MDLQSAEMPLKFAEHALPEGRRVGSVPRPNAVALQYDFRYVKSVQSMFQVFSSDEIVSG